MTKDKRFLFSVFFANLPLKFIIYNTLTNVVYRWLFINMTKNKLFLFSFIVLLGLANIIFISFKWGIEGRPITIISMASIAFALLLFLAITKAAKGRKNALQFQKLNNLRIHRSKSSNMEGLISFGLALFIYLCSF